MNSRGIQLYLLALWTKFKILSFHEVVTIPKKSSVTLQARLQIQTEFLGYNTNLTTNF
jgi:hypothetical protein